MASVLIYGKGKVGQSLVRFCKSIGQEYVICDDTDAPGDFSEFKSIIPSPGIPSSHRIYETNKIVSELDFIFSSLPKDFQIHAVTGTDGKSTTSWILYNFLKGGFSDMPVYLGGNFGTPIADVVMDIRQKEEKAGHIVLEVSSFMAYSLRTFYATNTILTNLHPDHLDWHRDIGEYYGAKLNLLAHTKENIVYPASALTLCPELSDFPLQAMVLADTLPLENNLLALSSEVFLDVSEKQLFGTHNIRNIYSAAMLSLRLGIPVKTLSSILPYITALPHRLQQISQKDDKIWIDDSKSTTAQSLYAALSAFGPQKVHLIAGGKDKGDPFTELAQYLKEYCAQCVVIGETKPIFLQACHDAFVPALSVQTMEEAVDYMSAHTQTGDIILLSPGCASFDMFRDYEDRAEQFALAIHARK